MPTSTRGARGVSVTHRTHAVEPGGTHTGSSPMADATRLPRLRLLGVAAIATTATLLLLGVALATLASAHVAASAISAGASADHALATSLLERIGAGATKPPADPGDETRLRRLLDEAVTHTGVLGVALHGPDGRRWAVGGEVAAPEGDRGWADDDEATAELVQGPDGPLLVETFPVRVEDRTVATLVVTRDGAPALAMAGAAQRDIAVASGLGATVVIVLVILLVRAAQRRLDEQTRQLLEAERHDPLTGHLTHGAALAELARAIDADLLPIAVGVVDIDNLRQLNETHGHELGDEVIRRVASSLGGVDVPGVRIGRSGPDEFLLVAPSIDASTLAAALTRLNQELLRTGVDTAAGDALPVSISAGISVAPLHGQSVTELVSAAGLTLGEAKSGGGAAVLISRLSYADLVVEQRATFSMLDGLVNAIDARDRYTRNHSEDVARYALFLAGRVGMDADFREAVHRAALLHDVGKISIPDGILRKPASLTDEEFEIMQQHPVLGHALVRDIGSTGLVGEGVRHHHERWDGGGYPDGLAGDSIPLIARIIAIADAFSAMTTPRPYRRALKRGVALERLVAAAGTQLDPRLTDVFVLSMESDPSAPAPSDTRAPAAWLVEGTAA